VGFADGLSGVAPAAILRVVAEAKMGHRLMKAWGCPQKVA
jgi:hypothetical protein